MIDQISIIWNTWESSDLLTVRNSLNLSLIDQNKIIQIEIID